MANEGMLVTAGITLAAAASFLLAAHAAHRGDAQRRTICAFYLSVGLYLTLGAARQVAAYAGAGALDRALFLALVAPAGLAVVPLVHLTVLVLSGSRRLTWLLDGASLGVVLVGLASFYAGGVGGPVVSHWGTDWSIHSAVTQAVLFFGVTLPALAAGATIVLVSRRLEGQDRRRLRAVGWSIVVYYVVFTTDALALSRGVLVVERLVTAVAALWAWSAYRHDDGDGHVERASAVEAQ